MLLTSSLSAAEFEAASEDLLDESQVAYVCSEIVVFLSKTGLDAAGPRTILVTSLFGQSFN